MTGVQTCALPISDVLGKAVSLVEYKNKPLGNYIDDIYLDNNLAAGIYSLAFSVNGKTTTKRVVIE